MKLRTDPFTIGFIIIALIAVIGGATNTQAGEVCATCINLNTVDAVVADRVYTNAESEAVVATTRPFAVPSGYKMIEVAQPDKIVCSAYPQAPIWSMVPIAVRKPKIIKVGRDNTDILLNIIEEAQ